MSACRGRFWMFSVSFFYDDCPTKFPRSGLAHFDNHRRETTVAYQILACSENTAKHSRAGVANPTSPEGKRRRRNFSTSSSHRTAASSHSVTRSPSPRPIQAGRSVRPSARPSACDPHPTRSERCLFVQPTHEYIQVFMIERPLHYSYS